MGKRLSDVLKKQYEKVNLSYENAIELKNILKEVVKTKEELAIKG